MITSLESYPLDHRDKLGNFADYVYFIIKIWKCPLLANEIYIPQTHFGFTNLCSNLPRFWVNSSQKVKNWTRTPCIPKPKLQFVTVIEIWLTEIIFRFPHYVREGTNCQQLMSDKKEFSIYSNCKAVKKLATKSINWWELST